jgi:subtilisin family serine protease
MAALHRSLGSTVLKSLDYLKLHRILLRDGLSEQEGKALYRASAIVAIAERHALRYPMLAPNDPYYANNSQWGVKKIKMPTAWDITTGKANVVIGVIDTGVDTGHPDFVHPDSTTNLLPGWDFAGTQRSVEATDADSSPMDKDGHGTHVSGIIAAVGNNGVGVAGIGWALRIMPLKVLADDFTINPLHEMETFDIVAAIDYAIAEGVRVVNCSFGGEAAWDLQNEYDAFDRLRQAGILAVCAAGNHGNDNAGAHAIYPASHNLDNIVSVAASTSADGLWSSSNYGLTTVDLMAPGDAIYSTCLCSPTGACGTGSAYCSKYGTSMAAPHVSGVAGLILSRNPNLSYSRVKSAILDSVDRVGPATQIPFGGRLNATAALGQVCLAGDLNKDGRVDLTDVVFALQTAAGLDHGSGSQPCLTADVDRDDQIGLAEAIYGLKVLSGL